MCITPKYDMFGGDLRWQFILLTELFETFHKINVQGVVHAITFALKTP